MAWAGTGRSYLLTCCSLLKSDGHLFDSSSAQGVSLPLGGKQSELLLLVLTETVAIPEPPEVRSAARSVVQPSQLTLFLPDFIIVGRQLLQQLLDPIFLSHRVDVGHLVVRQRGEVEVDLHTQRELSNFLITVFFSKEN